MSSDLLTALEQRVNRILDMVELLRLQVEELEEENIILKAEREKWRHDLTVLLRRFDEAEIHSTALGSVNFSEATHEELV